MNALDHIGIAVRSLEERLPLYRSLGLSVSAREEVPAQKVRVAFLPLAGGRLELLEPTAPDSPIAGFLARRGEGLHHICITVADIRAAMAELKRQGAVLLSDEPQPGADGCLICFVHPKSAGGVLLELSQPTGRGSHGAG
jgi:methylmalonyl-CoA/ethylmalonyl-CoA epimerase